MRNLFVSLNKLISEAMVFFYAVAKGRNPGVYATWEECKAEVHKYPHPIYKKFPSKSEAEKFVTTRGNSYSEVKSMLEICSSNIVPNKSKKIDLGVAIDTKSPYDEMEERLKDWAKKWVKNKPFVYQLDVQLAASEIAEKLGIENFNPQGGWLKYHLECNLDIYKSIRTQNDDGEIGNVAEDRDAIVVKKLSSLESRISGLSTKGVSISGRVKLLETNLRSMHQELHEIKRYLSTNSNPGTSISQNNRKRKKIDEVGEEDEEDASEISPDMKKTSDTLSSLDVDEQGFVDVYTDGACSGNGRSGAAAGIGVWFGDDHPLNVSRPVEKGCRATNNLAEIQAVTEAARQAAKVGIKKLRINTDSQFLISCITKWMPKWKKNGWKKADGEPVINKIELVEMEAALKPLTIAWNHVRGHAGVHGNEMADKLARAGAAAQSKK